MFHIGGIGWTYCGLWHGATTDPRQRVRRRRRVLDILERQRVTNAVLVPTMLQMLTAVPGAAERDYSALRSIAYGAVADHHAGAQGGAAHVRLRAVRRSTA